MDKRVRLLTEVINNIRAVKLYAYESLFGCKVQAKRQEEVKALRKLSACNAVSSSFMYFIPTLAAIGEL
jgi:ABC-type bacteriocin/lantibiotic exporter with double-glycine peptidase domain